MRDPRRPRRILRGHLAVLALRTGIAFPGGLLGVVEDRPGPRAFSTNRPGTHPAEPPQVHLAGRAHRSKRQGPGLDTDSADRHPALSIRGQAARRRRSGRRQPRRPGRRRTARSSPGKARRGATRASTRSRSTSRSTSSRPSSAKSSSSPTSRTRARARSRTHTIATQASAASGPSRFAISSGLTAKR